MIYECVNAYYFRSILAIGGIESHLYYIAQKYGKWDITVFFQHGDPAQLRRLRQFVKCIQVTPADKIVCDTLFCCFNKEVLDFCEAKHKYLVLHGDYEDMVERKQLSMQNLPLDDRVDEYLGVSQHVCDSWERLTGRPAMYVGEPVVLEKEKPLLLLSATRLSAEKGWGRMEKLARAMVDAGIPYEWFVYTNSPQHTLLPRFHFRQPELNISRFMPMFDAVVQLSDNEGYCLSVVEAFLQGIPCILTDCPVFHEIGATDSNSVLLRHDMTDIPIDRIRDIKKLKGFKYRQPKDDWSVVLNHTKSTYKKKAYTVRATNAWKQMRLTDTQFGYVHEMGDEWEIDEERYQDFLAFEKRVGRHLIDVVKD